MLLAASTGDPSADTTVIAAFAVGFASFISPCVLPLVPGYLSTVSGMSLDELRSDERPLSRVLWPGIIFCLSFTVIFVALGMSATSLGSALSDNRSTLDRVAGALIIAMGAFFLLTPLIPALNKEWRPDVLISKASAGGGPLIAGAAFAIAWTPCVGPTLGSILTAASASSTVGHGGVLLAFYSAGLAVPFLLSAIAFDRATTAFRWLRDHYVIITAISGAVLIFMGILMVSNELTWMNAQMQKLMGDIGLDFVYSL